MSLVLVVVLGPATGARAASSDQADRGVWAGYRATLDGGTVRVSALIHPLKVHECDETDYQGVTVSLDIIGTPGILLASIDSGCRGGEVTYTPRLQGPSSARSRAGGDLQPKHLYKLVLTASDTGTLAKIKDLATGRAMHGRYGSSSAYELMVVDTRVSGDDPPDGNWGPNHFRHVLVNGETLDQLPRQRLLMVDAADHLLAKPTSISADGTFRVRFLRQDG